VFAALTVALVVAAAPRPEEPDWPCQQRLVPRLSPATYWSGSVDEQRDWRTDPEVADLVRELVPRAVTEEQGLTRIAAFARTVSGDRSSRLALAFSGLLQETDRERADLIERLKQIGHRQRELTGLAARLASELDSIPAAASGEAAAKRADLQQRRDFTTRNLEEVQRTLRYACEVPIRLDARLGVWARALQQAVNAAAPG
jgi:hypothetical protein